MQLRIHGIVAESIVDGPGIRYVVFTQGCPHQCIGCHNPTTHDLYGGYNKPIHEIIDEIRENPLLDGLTISGGEPMIHAETLINLCVQVRKLGKNITIYSGYTYEQILSTPLMRKLLSLCDILVDGKFELENRSLMLAFRGSSNQRMIDIQKSIQQNDLVLYM